MGCSVCSSVEMRGLSLSGSVSADLLPAVRELHMVIVITVAFWFVWLRFTQGVGGRLEIRSPALSCCKSASG